MSTKLIVKKRENKWTKKSWSFWIGSFISFESKLLFMTNEKSAKQISWEFTTTKKVFCKNENAKSTITPYVISLVNYKIKKKQNFSSVKLIRQKLETKRIKINRNLILSTYFFDRWKLSIYFASIWRKISIFLILSSQVLYIVQKFNRTVPYL